MVPDREKALGLLHQYISSENMRKHCIASEAVMRKVAERLGRDVDKWGITGLLHDLDAELVDHDPETHALKTAEILTEMGVDDDMVDAIKMHNEEASGKERYTEFQHGLAASETITGLITATTLVYPDKKLASVKPKSITKRMKEKHFAASVKRDHIRECEQIGIPLQEFVELSLDGMRSVSDELGL